MNSSVCDIFPAHRVFSGFLSFSLPRHRLKIEWSAYTRCAEADADITIVFVVCCLQILQSSEQKEKNLVRNLMIVDDSGMSHTRRMLMPTNKPSLHATRHERVHTRLSRLADIIRSKNNTIAHRKNSQGEFGFTMFLCVEIWINSIFLSRLCCY